MRLQELNKAQKQILLMTARLGYINKKIFFDNCAIKSTSYKYRLWDELVKNNLLEACSRKTFENYYYLSKGGQLLLRQVLIMPVAKTNPIYFEHDDTIMQFILASERTELISDNWYNEAILKRLGKEKIYSIFKQDLHKLPDLTFDLALKNRKVRIALEVERSSKHRARYDLMVVEYAKAKGVDLVLIVNNNNYIKQSVIHAMRKFNYPKARRPIGFIDYKDFEKNITGAVISVDNKSISFAKYVENLKQLPPKLGENRGETVCTSNSPNLEVA